ncbi:hypothetical protein BDW62DRAFT_196779 [Aspergillus aurantiobrunneus]
MYDAFSNRGPPSGPGYGYGFGYPPHPPPQSGPQSYSPGPGYGHPHGPPPPGPGFGYTAPPPAYDSHNRHGYNNSHAYPYSIPSPPPSNHSGYPPEKLHGHGPGPMNSFHPNQPPNGTNSPQALVLRQSPETHKIIHIHPAGTPTSAAPLYSLTSFPKNSEADYVLARGPDPNAQRALVAEVKSHTFSSKYDLIVRGTQCTLKASASGTNYNIEIPQMGRYKWVTDQENLSSKMWLKDEGKRTVLATYDKHRGPSSVGTWKKFVGGRDRELVMNVPASEFFVEVLLVSLYAVKMAKEGALEAAGEIIGAVAGA